MPQSVECGKRTFLSRSRCFGIYWSRVRKASLKGLMIPQEAPYWHLLVNPFHGFVRKVKGCAIRVNSLEKDHSP